MELYKVFFPELFLATSSFILLLINSLFIKNKAFRYISFLFIFILSFIFLLLYPPNFSNQIDFSSHFLNLKVHYLFRLIFLFLGMLLYISLYKFFLNEKYMNEFSFFLGTTIPFLSLISSSQNIFLAFILMEAISFSFYLLISFYKREILCLESGLKYYILGTISSIFFFIGLFLIYYSSLEINFYHGLTKIIYSKKATYFFLGLILIFSSLAFKLGASPFHFWLPEVYQGSPLPVFPILIAFSKLSFALFLSNLILIFLYNGGGLITKEIFYNFFYIVSILSMIVGNLFALKQKELKRLLAYSSISHIGYLLTLFSIPWSNENLKLFYGYIFIYVLTNFGIFLAISIFINFKDIKIPIETFKDHLKSQNFLILFSLLIFFFSLAGLPPTAGFITKFFLLLEIVKKGSYLLAFIFLLTSILSIYYYFRLINPVLTVFREGVYEGGYMKREFNEIFIMIILLGLSFYLLLSTFKPVLIFFFA
mgnify:CR=1 FL=1